MELRLRSKQKKTFQELLAEQSQSLRAEAQKIPHGTARDLLLRRASQVENASQMNGWLSSSGLQPPK